MKNRKNLILLLILLGIVTITLGVTLAFFNYVKKGSTENVLETSTITFHYDETNKMGNGISIVDALPVDSNQVEKTNNNYFEFNISGKSNSADISYLITARKSNGSDDLDNMVDIYLTDENDNPLFGGIHKYSNLVQYSGKANYTEKVIYTDVMEGNGIELNKNFRLRMWIDERTDFSNGNYNNKTFKITVNVYTDDIDGYEPQLESGFYNLDGNQIYTWNELLDNGYYSEESGVLNRYANTEALYNMEGNIILDKSVTELSGGIFAGSVNIKTVSIPNSVTKINSGAFYSSNVESIIFEKNSNLQTIDGGTFNNTSKLKKLEIPASVKSINPGVFSFSSLETITFEKNSNITDLYAVFNGANHLKSVIIPKSVLHLQSAFSSSTIESVVFEDGTEIEKIDPLAFYMCSNLKSITIPKSVTSIAYDAFSGSGLETITFEKGSKLEEIESNTFNSLVNLKSLEIPANVVKIQGGSFSGSGLETITFEKGSKLEEIESNTFNSLANLKSLEIPANVVKIQGGAFLGSGLETITFEKGSKLEEIESNTFNSLVNLKSLEIPANVVKIHDGAFSGSGLETITFEENSKLKTINTNSFGGCSELKNIEIPANVTLIEEKAFQYNPNLSSVTFENPNGWYANDVELDSNDLADATTARTYLKDTYLDSTWSKAEKLNEKIILNAGGIDNINELDSSAFKVVGGQEDTVNNGLYKMTVTNGFGGQTETGTTYFFRGKVENNYVKFADMLWRVIRINEDGSTRIILDDSIDKNKYALNENAYLGKEKMYYSSGTTSETAQYVLNDWYSTNIDKYKNGTSGYKYSDKVVSGRYFCEQAKLISGDYDLTNIPSAKEYNDSSFELSLSCSGADGHGIVPLNSSLPHSQSIGLLTLEEFIMAGARIGMYSNSTNYFFKGYEHENNYPWWTMSPGGITSAGDVYGWNVNMSGYYDLGNNVIKLYRLRPVINLKADTKVVTDANGHYVVVK